MKAIEKDDIIGRLIREEGLIKASPDLTAKIMLRVESKAARNAAEYEPLLSRNAWMIIAGAVLAVIGFSAWYVMPETSSLFDFLGILKPAAGFLSDLHFNVQVKPQLLMIGTIVVSSTGMLLLLDYYLNKINFRRLKSTAIDS